jgi:hypothetical protein
MEHGESPQAAIPHGATSSRRQHKIITATMILLTLVNVLVRLFIVVLIVSHLLAILLNVLARLHPVLVVEA